MVETIQNTIPSKRPGFFNSGCLVWLFASIMGIGLMAMGYLVGPRLLGWPQVPNLTLLPESNAAFYLDQLGLRHQIFTVETDNPLANGVVIGQEPLPGRFINPNRAVRLSIGIFISEETAQPVVSPTPDAPIEESTEALTEDSAPTATLPPVGLSVDVEIAFASDRGGTPQIWLSKLDGSNLIQLTEMSGGACQPDWSADGSQLVFVSPCSGNEETYPDSTLWIISVDGTALQQLTDGPGDYDPAWSPDGDVIAFTSARETRTQLYFFNLTDGSITNYSSNLAFEFQPFWSMDGSQLGFVTTTTGSPTIFIRTVGDTGAAIFSRNEMITISQPVWSADGARILYNQRMPSGLPGIMVATIANNGYNAIPLIAQPSPPMRDADLSLDGSWMAYEGWPDGVNHDIWVSTPSGAQPQRVTSDAAFDFDPALRP
jgi:Tol biopolymer transport system component